MGDNVSDWCMHRIGSVLHRHYSKIIVQIKVPLGRRMYPLSFYGMYGRVLKRHIQYIWSFW